MKRRAVRSGVLGAGWEERFLAAVRAAREKGLIPAGESEKLRRLAGAYLCPQRQQEHRTESAMGRKHLRWRRELEEVPKSEGPPLKVGPSPKAKARKGRGAKG